MVGCDFFFFTDSWAHKWEADRWGAKLKIRCDTFFTGKFTCSRRTDKWRGDLKSEGNLKSDSILFYRQICL